MSKCVTKNCDLWSLLSGKTHDHLCIIYAPNKTTCLTTSWHNTRTSGFKKMFRCIENNKSVLLLTLKFYVSQNKRKLHYLQRKGIKTLCLRYWKKNLIGHKTDKNNYYRPWTFQCCTEKRFCRICQKLNQRYSLPNTGTTSNTMLLHL